MTHELKQIVRAHVAGSKSGLKSVMATVVALNGSSYRRPGVRMLIHENGKMVGAVSGGCVEKEVLRQAASVFETGVAKVMTYDGRYRLGCEGILYILIEPFSPSEETISAFEETLSTRTSIEIHCYFKKEVIQETGLGSEMELLEISYPVSEKAELNKTFQKFSQTLQPCYRLLIVGSEHDAVQLCAFAHNMGWEVDIIAHPTEEKQLKDFPGARSLRGIVADDMNVSQIDGQTAIVLMTHSYVKDLQFLIALEKSQPAYLGLLGPNKRREKLLNEFLEHCPEVEDTFFDHVYGPAGLNIGGETPQEIAIAILAEILTVIRGKKPMLLRDKEGGIHS
jgi:xanthine/CO dehydrogenase XdhC/CoxF family maturation factor